MLRNLEDLTGYKLLAKDGEIGVVSDFYFDDRKWSVRYLVVDVGGWILKERVLISTLALETSDWVHRVFPVALTQDQVKNSPEVDLDKPVSRQHEIALHEYYGWTPYWDGLSPTGPTPTYLRATAIAEEDERARSDPHLRSVQEVKGYHIQARDGEIGHVESFLVDDQGWELQYMIVDTQNWLPGRKVLISPAWVEDIDWLEAQVEVDLLRETVRNSPEYDPSGTITRVYEEELHDHYGRERYWT
jgi:hypothetical protein